MRNAKRAEKNKISVVIPIYNSVSTIGKCIRGLYQQESKPHEIIIVDDGSADGLDEEIEQIKKELKLKNLIFLKQKHKGVSEARNLGVKYAEGNILAFTDSDCIPPKFWLRNILKTFEKPGIGAVGGGYSSGIDKSFWQQFSWAELAFRRRDREYLVKTLLSNNMACFRKDFLNIGGFSKKYPVCEDMLLAYKISQFSNIAWLKNNGVKHHFKTNLKDYLKHQYFFGKQSAKFFLDNPQILVDNNHQGKQLHFAIATSFLVILLFILEVISMIFLPGLITKIVSIVLFLTILSHMVLYFEFIFYLSQKNFSIIDLIKAYLVSFFRDIIAGLSFFSGLTLYIKERKF
ncbi:MAG: glycosyltransferase family 2 protein [Actinobacteria bacterium]|nr:glycosyltransferase family 2 protein [Actinomycetota bacterium]